ncbi:polyhydroxyalkanoate depolymerase [Rodentibacter ratti]|uniref:Polyhydroxyalkanoate depolymerase n=2 Tax=Rodentibacter ratti TaxID=1906745 RepID=A0A1V3KY33_9PAST|nr:polyhydroxyalkanoate depolymerase [Rodentibacter ratti]
MLHHNGIVHNYDIHTLAWKQALAFEVLFYWAVPVFFMLTGATLIRYREKYSTVEFFKKRVTKTFFPFIFFSLLLSIYFYLLGEFNIDGVRDWIGAIFTTRVPEGWAYWFFIPLFALYTLIPVLSHLRDKKSILLYIVIAIFITHSCLPILFQIIGIQYNWDISFPVNGYVMFLLIGFLLSETHLSKRVRISFYTLGVLGAIIRYYGTIYYSTINNSLDRILFGYTQFHSVFLAVAIFIFIKGVSCYIENERFIRIIKVLSSCSFGIYLIHVFMMYKVELLILAIEPDNVYWRFFGAFLTYFLCFSIVYLIKKIPFLRKIFP